MINSRSKGSRVELEFISMIKDSLGVSCVRNLEQVRSGGHDIVGLDGWAPEVKARAAFPTRSEFTAMWVQTLKQAEASKQRPVLAIKVNRRGWSIYIDASDLCPDIWQPGRSWVCMEPDEFFQFVRANLQ